MKPKYYPLLILVPALLLFCGWVTGIHWYTDEPVTTTLADTDAFSYQKVGPNAYRYITVGNLKSVFNGAPGQMVNNFYVTNLYASNAFITNLVTVDVTVQSNLYVSNNIYAPAFFTTNLYSSNIFTTNLFTTNLFATYITNDYFYTTNLYSTTNFNDYSFITNLFSTNIYTTNLFASFITNDYFYSTNIFATTNFNDFSYITNLYVSNAFVTNLYVTNAYITNLTVQNITNVDTITVQSNVVVKGNLYVNNISITNGFYRALTTWVGPTNSLDVGTNFWIYTAPSDCAITNFTGGIAGFASDTALVVTNAATSNITFRITAGGNFLDYAKSYTVTNGDVLHLAIERQGTAGADVVGRTGHPL